MHAICINFTQKKREKSVAARVDRSASQPSTYLLRKSIQRAGGPRRIPNVPVIIANEKKNGHDTIIVQFDTVGSSKLDGSHISLVVAPRCCTHACLSLSQPNCSQEERSGKLRTHLKTLDGVDSANRGLWRREKLGSNRPVSSRTIEPMTTQSHVKDASTVLSNPSAVPMNSLSLSHRPPI